MIGRTVSAQLASEKRVDWWRISMSIPPAIGRSCAFGMTKLFRSLKPPPNMSPENSRATGRKTATSCQVVVA